MLIMDYLTIVERVSRLLQEINVIVSLQEITSNFRVNYCKMWQAIISADLDGIKKYSEKMGVGDQYGLFACMLSARTWDTVVNGLEKTPLSQNEVQPTTSCGIMFISLCDGLPPRGQLFKLRLALFED